MNFFDPNITKYVLKWKGDEGLALKLKAEIQKEDGTKLGKLETKGMITKKTYLTDTENSVLLISSKSKWSLGAKYDVKDSADNLIGVVNQKLLARKKIMDMKNSDGDIIVKFEGSTLLGKDHQINSIDGKNIAIFSREQDLVKTSRWRGETHNTCILKINDPTFDRKSLFGIFISCLSSYLDHYKSEMTENIESFKK